MIFLGLVLALTPISEKLKEAQEEVATAQEQVATLKRAYYEEQIAEIKKSLDAFEAQLPQIKQDPERYRLLLTEELPLLFDEERAMLDQIVDEEPSLAPQAKPLLKRILELLTQLNAKSRKLTPSGMRH